MRKSFVLPILLLLAFALAACGDDDKKDDDNAQPTPTAAESEIGPVGPALDVNSPTESADSITDRLPGCSDPNSDECPSPLQMDLDGEISAGGITVKYPARYFVAAEAASGAIEIAPSENNKFEEQAAFTIAFADSIESALSGLTNPDTGEWSSATLSGTIGVSKDQTQDPPQNTTIGAFALADGRVIVVQVITTGTYGWDLWMRVYEDMLNALVIE